MFSDVRHILSCLGTSRSSGKLRQDQEAVDLIETKTARIEVDSVFYYTTPLLRKRDTPHFQAPKEAVMQSLRST